ncbi:hypothetical protein LUZ60_008086 [Juncus effusus]|nr:hypothetical protein LUZ60_008086 [Juncus effusus]
MMACVAHNQIKIPLHFLLFLIITRSIAKAKSSLMATPLILNTIPSSSSSSSSPSSPSSSSSSESPVLIFLCFHKAIRCELGRLHRWAVELATTDGDGDGKVGGLADGWRVFHRIYKHHCQAEDAVIFPALDLRVKNVAFTYSLEHEGERDLFTHLFNLLKLDVKNCDNLRRELASCTGAIQTSLTQHMSKEEEQIFPLLIEKFSFDEQAELVWRFLCNIPVNMMAEFLPWLITSVSSKEHQDIIKCLRKIIPSQKLLQEVIFSWMKGKSQSEPGQTSQNPNETQIPIPYSCNFGKRKHEESDYVSSNEHPIDEILLWHNCMRVELSEIAEEARKISEKDDFSDLDAFNLRLQFVADVCIFHSIAEDEIIFPAVDGEVSFEQEHKEEKSRFNKLRDLIENIRKSGAESSITDFYSELCAQADQIVGTIDKHFRNEETQVLPLARAHFSREKQRELMYKSLCVMPLKLLERVLPWLVSKINDEEQKLFLLNIQFGASMPSESALVSLLSGWACKARCIDKSISNEFTCTKSQNNNNNNNTSELEDFQTPCPCEFPLSSSRQVKRVNSTQKSKPKSCCVPNLGINKDSHLISHSIYSSLFSFSAENTSNRPIDTIFKFHKAIRKDVEYLDKQSSELLKCDLITVREFFGRFRMLWGLYRAHSTAEDNIVFPALEAKESLSNVSLSYMIDHKMEEELFQEVNGGLMELSEMLKDEGPTSPKHSPNWARSHKELATRLQSLCKSLSFTLSNHVHREETELWPLFALHFTEEEQEGIVGRIIGTTGAEVLQAMLPWVTTAVSTEEQDGIVGTWRNAARNTMFGEWLDVWWNKGGGKEEAGLDDSLNGSELQEEMMDQNNEKFKPGWKDIFRMNQNELESEVRRLSRDTTLDPRRKAYLIQNLMTSRWIAAQQKIPQEESETNEPQNSEGKIQGHSPSYRDPQNGIFGCEHYKRNCKLVALCCDKLFVCRFCHDKVSDHTMDRKAVREMMCMKCLKVQPISPNCSTPSCNGFSMAKYYCNICKLFDDDRNIYHCPFCNLCRLGRGLGIDFFHCMKCNCCLGLKLVDHKCRERMLETNCPICCDFLFTSSAAMRALPCGHFMHSACFQAYTSVHYTCPICCKSLGDMTVYFGMLDALLASEQLPEEYINKCQDILCNDCDKKGRSRFHWLYHKCGFCGSYNTRVIKTDTTDCSTSN